MELLGEASKSLPAPSKGKDKEAAQDDTMIVSVASEDTKIHQPTFLFKGQPLLAKESALKSPGVAYSLLGHSILPSDEEEIQKMSENALKNQAFHSLMKVIFILLNFPYLVDFPLDPFIVFNLTIVSPLFVSRPICSSGLRTKSAIRLKISKPMPRRDSRNSRWTIWR